MSREQVHGVAGMRPAANSTESRHNKFGLFHPVEEATV